jgi:hypothetical protein
VSTARVHSASAALDRALTSQEELSYNQLSTCTVLCRCVFNCFVTFATKSQSDSRAFGVCTASARTNQIAL